MDSDRRQASCIKAATRGGPAIPAVTAAAYALRSGDAAGIVAAMQRVLQAAGLGAEAAAFVVARANVMRQGLASWQRKLEGQASSESDPEDLIRLEALLGQVRRLRWRAEWAYDVCQAATGGLELPSERLAVLMEGARLHLLHKLEVSEG